MGALSLILIAVAVMLILALSVVIFVVMHQKGVITHQLELKTIAEKKELELIKASIQGEEEERMRIASELHDDVAATLSSIRLFLYSAANTSPNRDLINQSKDLLDESLSKIRSLSHRLQPSSLVRLRLQASIQALMETLQKSNALQAKHVARNTLPLLNDNVELAVYRVLQELINNLLKHAQPSVVSVETGTTEAATELLLTHNGHGLTQQMYQEMIYKKGSIGLKNIVNRLKSIGAEIDFSKKSDNLYTIKISVPLTDD